MKNRTNSIEKKQKICFNKKNYYIQKNNKFNSIIFKISISKTQTKRKQEKKEDISTILPKNKN